MAPSQSFSAADHASSPILRRSNVTSPLPPRSWELVIGPRPRRTITWRARPPITTTRKSNGLPHRSRLRHPHLRETSFATHSVHQPANFGRPATNGDFSPVVKPQAFRCVCQFERAERLNVISGRFQRHHTGRRRAVAWLEEDAPRSRLPHGFPELIEVTRNTQRRRHTNPLLFQDLLACQLIEHDKDILRRAEPARARPLPGQPSAELLQRPPPCEKPLAHGKYTAVVADQRRHATAGHARPAAAALFVIEVRPQELKLFLDLPVPAGGFQPQKTRRCLQVLLPVTFENVLPGNQFWALAQNAPQGNREAFCSSRFRIAEQSEIGGLIVHSPTAT